MINLSSSSAIVPLAYMSIYASTKRYNHFLSESVRLEVPNRLLASGKIAIQSVQPFFVETKSTHSVKKNPGDAKKVANIMSSGDQGVFERLLLKIRPLPDAYVQQSIKTIGYSEHTFGSFAHTILGNLV